MTNSDMTQEGALVLACARSYSEPHADMDFIGHTYPHPDWMRVIHLSREHNLLPVVAARLTDRSFEGYVPQDVRSQLKMMLYSAIRHDAMFRAWMAEMLDRLASEGIHPVVLKGPVLADSVYPFSYLRLSGDLDLMVSPCELVRAGTALLDAGYKVTHHLPAAVGELEGTDLSPLNSGQVPTATAGYSRGHDYHISFEGTASGQLRLVELHWKPAPARSAVLPMDDIHSRIVPIRLNERRAFALAPEHQTILLIFHMISHGWREGFLRSLLDLSLVTRAWPDMDWSEITRLCGRQSARGHAYHVLSWAVTHMGAQVPDEVLTALCPTAYQRWSSRPFRCFQNIVSLDDRKHTLRDLTDGLSESASVSGKAMFLLGAAFPSMRGLAQMRGLPAGPALYTSYVLRPIALCRRLIARRKGTSLVPLTAPRKQKAQLADRSTAFRMVERVNTWGSSLREESGMARGVGRLINFSCARGFDLYSRCLVGIRRLTHQVNLERLAIAHTAGASSDDEKADALCHFVYHSIAYARSVTWLEPADVLGLGYGDCKCQSRLLHGLLSAVGIESRVAVGITGRRAGTNSVHAWVEARLDGNTVIYDPTLCSYSLDPDEYDRQWGGILDVTPEYAMKRSDAS